MKKIFERHIQRIERKITQLEKQSSKISGIRLMVFVLAGVFLFIGLDIMSGIPYTITLFALIFAFLFMVDRHRKVEVCIERFGYLMKIKREHIARIELDWEDIPFKEVDRNEHSNHPYAQDFNIIGQRSLFQLMDTAIYEGSAKVLSKWLLDQDKEKVANRQHLVQELAPLQLFRDKLQVEASFTKKHTDKFDWTMEQMLEWLRLPKKIGFELPLILLTLLSVSNITLGLLALFGMLNTLFFVISFVSYLTLYKFNGNKVSGLYDASFQMEKLLGRFSNILRHVEKFSFRNESGLTTFLMTFHHAKERPSTNLKKVRAIAGAAALKQNQVLWPIVNMILPWDLYFSMKLENLKEDIEPKLTKWLDKFYELEALNSLANFTMLNPGYVFPTFNQNSDTLFKAEELGHPLINEEQKVANDFEVTREKDLFLLTGSNMAGKSTFLRTVGINLVLAYSGAPVNAESLNTNFYRLFSSININDSLGDGLSHFYAEVKRLRQLLDELNKNNETPLFFFVDEIYKGTNNRERFAGSAAFLKEVAGKNGIGMISTHDLELADLESEISQLSNWHFAESISDGKMSFEYKLKKGPCPSTNALEIMKMEGLPVG